MQRHAHTHVAVYQAVCKECGENRGEAVQRPASGRLEPPDAPLPDELPADCDECGSELVYAYCVYRVPIQVRAHGAAS